MGTGHRSSPLGVAVALLAAAVVVGCGNDDASGDPSAVGVSGEIVVFAAASLTEAFTELGAAFEAEFPDASVTFSFAASSALVAQITEGAPADVFASADSRNMTKLTEADATIGAPVVFANNRSEIIVAPGNPLGITDLDDLADLDLVLVTCAPEAPCGSYATQIFENAGVTPTPDSYEDNVKAVVTKVALGEADAGIAYATDVRSAGADADGVEIPADVNVVAEYPIAVIVGAGREAADIVEFILSEPARELLATHGFGLP